MNLSKIKKSIGQLLAGALFVSALLFSNANFVYSQCCTNASYGQYPTTTYLPIYNDGTVETITSNAYSDEYSLIQVQSGYSYTFSTNQTANNNSKWASVTNADGTVCLVTGSTNSSTYTTPWVATYTGQVRFYTHRSNSCNNQGTKTFYRRMTCTAPQPPVADFSASATSGIGLNQEVTFTDASTENPTSWLWTFSPSTVTYVTGTSTSQNPTVTFDDPGIYTVTLKATNSVGNDTEQKIDYINSVENFYVMPISGTSSITTCTNNLKDPGGNGDYPSGSNGSITIYPSTSGSFVRLTFNSFSTEYSATCSYDYVQIYDGNSVSAPQITAGSTYLGKWCSTDNPGTITSTAADGSLTIEFISDGSVVNSGFDASISCYSDNNPSISSFSPTELCEGATVTITGTNFTGATAVSVGGTAVSSYTVNSATEISAVVGSGTTGVISVTTTDGTATSSGSLTINSYPTLSASSSASGICIGETVSLSGTAASANQIKTNSSAGSILDLVTLDRTIVVSGTNSNANELISLTLNLTHTWVEDLDITLQAPNGSSIILSSDNGSSGDNYTNTVFSTSGTAITLGIAPFTGTFTPEEPFSNLTGSADGTWTLSIYDDASIIEGDFIDFTIVLPTTISYSWSSDVGGFTSSDQNPTSNSITENTTYTLTATANGCSSTATAAVTSSAVTPGTIESSIDGGLTYGSSINTRQVGNDIYWDYTGSDFHSFEYSWDNGSSGWNTDFINTDPGSWGNGQTAGADGTLSIRAKAQCGTSVDYTNTVQTDWVYNYGGNANAPNSAVTASLSGTPSSLSNGGDMRIDQTVTFVKPSTSFESTNYAFQYEWNNDGNWSGDWVTGQNAVWSDNIGSNVSSGDAVLTVRTRHYGSGNDSYSAEYAVTLKKPVISTSGSLSAFSNCSGGASSAQSFNVSGSYLGSDVTITAPTGFELSESSGGTYTSSITLSPTNGTLASMAVFIRVTSSASGTPNGNVVCTATAATNVNVAASATVGSAPVITSASSFTGTTTCGVMSIDISVDTDGATGTWADGSNGLFVIGESETTNTYATNTYNTPLTLTWTNSSGAACANATATITARFNQPSPTGSMDTDSWVWGGLSNSTWTTGSNWYKWDGYKWLKQGASYPDAGSKIYVLPTSDVCVSSTLNNAATSLGDVNIQSGGSFDLGSTNTSITGNITNDGTMQGGTGTVTLSGSTDQTISGTGTINFNNLTVNKSSGSAIISTQTDIRNTLTMTKGNIVNSQPVVLGVNSSNPGTLSHASGTVTGELRRYFANATGSTFFPVGTSSNMRDVTINFTQPPGTDEYLTVSYLSGAPALVGSEGAYSGLPLVTGDNQLIQNYSADGHWNIDPTGSLYESTEINNANYEMTLHCKALSIQPTDISKVRIIKSAGSENSSLNHVTWTGLDLLSASGSPDDFTITAAAQGFSKFGAGSDDGNALPVELVSFNGSCNDGVVELNWETASEYNSSHFDVENSRDGITWDVVKTIDAAGNSNELLTYTYGDVSAHGGDNYYRLHQVDIDGTSKTYDVINVSCLQTTDGYFSIFPNPSSGSFQVMLNNSDIVGRAEMNIMDTKGNRVMMKSIDVKSGINMFAIDENLAPGIYYISVLNGNYSTIVLKHSVK